MNEELISWRPSRFGIRVLTSMIIFSALWTISGVAPTDAPGTMYPSSVIAVASTIAQSRGLVTSP